MRGNRPTIYDVANTAGVSKSLVSLVLQGSPRVSDNARQAVRAAIEQLGYRPNRAATDLASTRTGIVAVLIDDYANPWFVELLRGVTHAVGPTGYRVTVVDSSTTPPRQTPADALLSLRADGIVVARDMPSALADPSASAPPLVVAGTRDTPPLSFDAVANDDALGARLVAEHLLRLGHKSVVHISASGGAARARRESFVDAMRAGGADVFVSDYKGQGSESAGYELTLVALQRQPLTTAIFAANDVMAIGALGAAAMLGLSIPREMAVAGYDNTMLARTRLINLTSVDDNGFAVGREAGRLLKTRLAGAAGGATHLLLNPSLVVRGTTDSRLR